MNKEELKSFIDEKIKILSKLDDTNDLKVSEILEETWNLFLAFKTNNKEFNELRLLHKPIIEREINNLKTGQQHHLNSSDNYLNIKLSLSTLHLLFEVLE